MRNIFKYLSIAIFLSAIISACGKEQSRRNTTPVSTSIRTYVTSVQVYPVSCDKPTEIHFNCAGPETERIEVSLPQVLSYQLEYNPTGKYGIITITPTDAWDIYTSPASLEIKAIGPNNTATATIDLIRAEISFQDTYIYLASEGEDRIVEYSANVEATDITVSEDAKDWLMAEFAGANPYNLRLLCKQNEAYEKRVGTVLVKDRDSPLCVSLTVTQLPAEKPVDEREILLKIYNKLDGPNWNSVKNWSMDKPLSEWSGISTHIINGVEYVYYFHTNGRGLKGELPEELGELKYMQELWLLNEPGLTGHIPDSFGNLVRMKKLLLSNCSLSGEIPECLANMTYLMELSLSKNYFEGNLPLFLASLPRLESFSFYGNCLDGQIDESLTKTQWWTHNYGGIPSGIWELEQGQREGHRLWLAEEEEE